MAGKNATPVLTRMPAAKSLAKPKTLAFVPAPKIELVPVATEPAAPVLVLASAVSSGGAYRFKHALDFMLALVAAILTLPIVAVVSLVSALMFRAQPFFTQERVGANGVVFRVIKIRSLPKATAAYADREQLGVVSVGRWGSFIRSTHIDELPQFWSILTGEMSLVGPRPPFPHEVAQYEDWHKRRLSVTPGLTGLWQVSGRSDLPFDEMVMLDLYYIENWSLSLDLKIILRTIPTVISGRGAY
jgi:lipopolysaccharide/colanic/teichoic acid biosynthesis glycosyltransferase